MSSSYLSSTFLALGPKSGDRFVSDNKDKEEENKLQGGGRGTPQIDTVRKAETCGAKVEGGGGYTVVISDRCLYRSSRIATGLGCGA